MQARYDKTLIDRNCIHIVVAAGQDTGRKNFAH